MFPQDLIDQLGRAALAAVLVVEDPLDAVPAARALLEGGVTAIELAFRTPKAGEALRRIRDNVPGVVVGAGTVLNRAQVDEAVKAGAMFGVSPGCNPSTIAAARDLGLPFAPGVATASDIETAVENRCNVLKYFPAGTSGGLAHLESVSAPFAHLRLRYFPLGGINVVSLAEYLRSRVVLCVGGSWLADSRAVDEKDWEAIRARAAEAMAVVRTVRSGTNS